MQADDEATRHLNRRAAQTESDPKKLAHWLFDAASARLQARLSEHALPKEDADKASSCFRVTSIVNLKCCLMY